MADWRIMEGDCVDVMRAMAAESVDAVVCDPPYSLRFMGRTWDDQGSGAQIEESHRAWATEALRVLKPGGHLLAFGGTRTYHRLACAIEDAGFEIRDTIAWMYGSGFPKSLDVSKAIDKAAGAEREVVSRERTRWTATGRNERYGNHTAYFDTEDGYEVRETTAPATAAAVAWEGWGTALKPAFEPIVVARKPLAGTVAANVLAHGTGALNVDGCRVGTEGGTAGATRGDTPGTSLAGSVDGSLNGKAEEAMPGLGRWPANVVLDPEAAALLDEQTGTLANAGNRPESQGGEAKPEGSVFGIGFGGPSVVYDDRGGASRFFYCAKASSTERNAGLDGFEAQKRGSNFGMDGARPHTADDYVYEAKGARNVHPTVKPVALMRWLVRLVTPPGGFVLDPLAGSGTTGAATMLEGFRFVGIEREPEYAAIARARIAWWAEHPDGMELVERLEHERARKVKADAGQLDLFG